MVMFRKTQEPPLNLPQKLETILEVLEDDIGDGLHLTWGNDGTGSKGSLVATVI